MITKEPDRYSIAFVPDLSGMPQNAPGAIFIAPSSDQWNDFGFRIRVDVFVQPRDESRTADALEFESYLGIADSSLENGDVRDLERVVEEARQNPVQSDDLPDFFTMLPEMQAYRNLVDRLGAVEASAVLEAIHDMVATEESQKHPDWHRTAKETEVFLKGFLRFSESYFAWKNANSILHGEQYEELGEISDTVRIKYQLSGRPNSHDLTFRFSQREEVLPKRISVLIGKNGVGKSQALARIAKSAIDGDGDLSDEKGGRLLFNRVLAFYPTYASFSGFPAKQRKNAHVWYRRFSLSSPGFGRNRLSTTDLIVQLARSSERIRTEGRIDLFLNAVRAIEGHEELALGTRQGNSDFVYLSELVGGTEGRRLDLFASLHLGKEPMRVHRGQGYRLSSGEAAFVRFSALTSLYVESGTLLLIDEPETHLHPNFISRFVDLLDDLLESTGSVAIIATHSVYFVRETFEDQVIVLRSGVDREIIAEKPRLTTFGADVGAISYFVFGEDTPSRLAQEVENKIADNSDSFENVFENYKNDISLDLLGEIRDRIEGLNGGGDKN